MSVLDYELKYLDSKKMCIDRHIIVAQVSAQSENGLKAAEGILSYIGKIKKHDKKILNITFCTLVLLRLNQPVINIEIYFFYYPYLTTKLKRKQQQKRKFNY